MHSRVVEISMKVNKLLVKVKKVQIKFFRRFSEVSGPVNPLDNIKVLDLTRIVAGPFCTMILADLGAEVIKIEKPVCGDEARMWPPFIEGTEISPYLIALNRNKKSICVNLKSENGTNIIKELAVKCDVLVENYVPGKLDDAGLAYKHIHPIAPHLIYCSLTGFGSEGPYNMRSGYDLIAESMGGLLDITGPADGEPCKVGVPIADITTGLYAHGAIMAALLQRHKTGKGQHVECNLFSTQVACLINVAAAYLNAGVYPKRLGTAHGSLVPYESFQTTDGYITVGAGTNAQFAMLCRALNVSELLQDSRFTNNTLRVVNREALIEMLKACFSQKTTSEWMSVFSGLQFPYGPLHTVPQSVPTLRLTLRKPEGKKKVQWGSETVDNENMNKKKSKCCCVFKKPVKFGESSSESSDDECDNCQGHVEKKGDLKTALPLGSTSDTVENETAPSQDHIPMEINQTSLQ